MSQLLSVLLTQLLARTIADEFVSVNTDNYCTCILQFLNLLYRKGKTNGTFTCTKTHTTRWSGEPRLPTVDVDIVEHTFDFSRFSYEITVSFDDGVTVKFEKYCGQLFVCICWSDGKVQGFFLHDFCVETLEYYDRRRIPTLLARAICDIIENADASDNKSVNLFRKNFRTNGTGPPAGEAGASAGASAGAPAGGAGAAGAPSYADVVKRNKPSKTTPPSK